MHFLIHGVDAPRFGSDDGPVDRDEEHQSYMDGWLARMIARGPTLSPDGEEHTGSVHVLDLADLDTARRFAAEEPYARAGWYADVRVYPFRPLLEGTMWDRPPAPPGRPSSLVLASWAPRPVTDDLARRLAGAAWLFAGLLLTEAGDASVGFAGAVDLAPGAAAPVSGELLGAGLTVEVQRWRRGGRDA